MRLRTMGHLTVEALSSVRDNGLLSVAAVSTVGVSLLVLAIVTLLAANLTHMAAVLDAKVQVVVYLNSDLRQRREEALVRQVDALPGVRRAELITRTQALQQLKQELHLRQSLVTDVLHHNPLPDAIDISLTSPQAVAPAVRVLRRLPGVQTVNDKELVVERLMGLTRALRVLGVFLVAALGLATLVVVGNTVRVAVYARREQIAIMKLVGATNGFIRWPFFIEGALLGLGGAALAGLLVWWGYRWFWRAAQQAVPFLPLLPSAGVQPRLTEGLLAAGLLLGALGSAISVHRHLRV